MHPTRQKRPTRAEVLRKGLEEDIFSGRLKPGDRLDEVSLAERFSVSRTPVREALHQLSASGLVEVRPRQGAVVAQITLRRLIEIFDVMAELEGMCARLAARRMTTEERTALHTAHAACADAVAAGHDVDAYYEANWRFHDLIYVGSHNTVLEETTAGLRLRATPYRRHQLNRPGRLADSLREHETVLQAILDGDGVRADSAMRDHVSIQGDLFADLLSTLPTDFVG
ncbi:GntR family transcriptional regulator [Roseospira visakhapatnamensis]|uniref:DNA-binding GntR family transcriptional regulator n=1 Tax=Roseospira visakhapatnamensis TaxID=390880 RepID=A0A7W6RBJ2_9PROT|nr:DNA-binding GntR family transcriptional regulator [Roseospira visakhapatnamensis]